ncbi:hypothetical protein [Dongshaea marina]|uniref:hypothetical protein n=1 Tax=Dongshaea marina TaxID=2047966 RepID=UPI000D3E91E0|nr:hypothetical protein [Dongshaea marina]
MNKRQTKVLAALQSRPEWMCAKEISEMTGISENGVRCLLSSIQSENISSRVIQHGKKLYRYRNHQKLWSMALSSSMKACASQ